jgi:hypothetical protein
MRIGGSKRNYAQRCVDVFAEANKAIRAELGEIIARHAADGLLQSGATIRRSIGVFEKHTLAAVETLEREFAAVVQSRGGDWKRAMETIDTAIQGQLRSATHLLERPFRLANGNPGEPVPAGSSVAKAIEDELRGVGERLRRRHAAFSEGWTAPAGKPWHERHPIVYASIAAVGGALLTAAVGALVVWAG